MRKWIRVKVTSCVRQRIPAEQRKYSSVAGIHAYARRHHHPASTCIPRVPRCARCLRYRLYRKRFTFFAHEREAAELMPYARSRECERIRPYPRSIIISKSFFLARAPDVTRECELKFQFARITHFYIDRRYT